MAKKDEDLDINWEDPEAVARARGDFVEVDEDDPDETPETEEEETEEEAETEEETSETEEEAEEETEEEAEEEAETEEEPAAEDKDKGKGKKKQEPMIPKSRYDSKAAENRSLKEKLAQIERQSQQQAKQQKTDEQQQSLETEIDALEDQYMEAIGKDEMDKAKDLRKQIRTKERQLFQSEIAENADVTTDRTREQIRLDMTIDTIEENYPQFNPDSDDYDEAMVREVQELRVGFEATGRYTPTQALLRAIKYVLPASSPKEIEKEAEKKPAADEERKKAGLKKATAAAKKQPPKTTKVGDDSDALGAKKKIDVDKLSYDDLSKLPEATLKRLRGDYA